MDLTHDMKESFYEESVELLEELIEVLLELEKEPDNGDLLNRAFRSLHTLKGSGSMFGFEILASFAHEIETVFDVIRSGEIKATVNFIDLCLSATDIIKEMINKEGDTHDPSEASRIVNEIKKILVISTDDENEEKDQNTPKITDEEKKQEFVSETTYRIRFQPSPSLFQEAFDPEQIFSELEEIGTCDIVSNIDDNSNSNENNIKFWDIIITTKCDLNTIKDIFIFVQDQCTLNITKIDTSLENHEPRLGEILVEKGDVKKEIVEETLNKQKRIGELLVDEGVVNKSKVESALVEQAHIKMKKSKRSMIDSASSMRIAANKIDKLVDLVGELVTVQARLSQTATLKMDPELELISEEVERLTAELRDNTMSIRMLPIKSTFNKFKRVVRDLSIEMKKEVELITRGNETELDKSVIESLADPLVHLVRNCVDHGIESPEVRVAKGKPRSGTIKLSADYSDASVLIKITDDGAGMDSEKIRNIALEKGLINPSTEMSEHDVLSLIFAPGFSTAQTITNISGRGVGMDVVKKKIEKLQGTVDIQTKKDQGTTLTLQLPLTLAIIDGLLVMVGDDFFVLPLSSVEECMELSREEIKQNHEQHTIHVRGSLVPYIRLREQFQLPGVAPLIEQIVICSLGENKVGFVLDKVIGGHQTVIKSLGKIYKNIEGLSGATILGNGTVALIIDPVSLFTLSQNKITLEKSSK